MILTVDNFGLFHEELYSLIFLFYDIEVSFLFLFELNHR